MSLEWQNPPDADVILRASGGKEFHVHKLILSLASSVFRDTFSVPLPTPTESPGLPIVDVHDPPEAFEIFLQIIYPTRNPPINDVETLASVLTLADKYDAKAVLDAHKDYLPSMCISSPPIHIYAILCACGREKEAEAAARRVSLASLTSLSGPLLHLMAIEHYQRLVRFIVARDTKMREIASRHQADIIDRQAHRRRSDCDNLVHDLYASAVVAALRDAFEANPYVQVIEALSIVASARSVFTPCRDSCIYGVLGLRKYAEGLLEELVKVAEALPWEG
ncbi:hypothetical protein BDM02DRAFT_3172725 [Thelephora ganbajun]|uniref:Uncharacterized protein n=1 Tax=Thelephora ganbajun TaxID=370292 RepID=A0ACB6Z880_THEGA|nr:hypothetical protein BDM02DRAFT_3172725 [Thelephora ganbajun]